MKRFSGSTVSSAQFLVQRIPQYFQIGGVGVGEQNDDAPEVSTQQQHRVEAVDAAAPFQHGLAQRLTVVIKADGGVAAGIVDEGGLLGLEH